jgi:uncharacterized protein
MDLTSKTTRLTIFGAVGIISVALILSALIFSNANLYIKNLGTSLVQDGRLVNTISVSGDGKVFAKPDMVTLTITASKVGNSSAEALEMANTQINKARDIILGKGVDAIDIQTSQFSIYPEYEYRNSSSILIGQRATVGISIDIKRIDDKATKATDIIDEVASIDDIQIGSISFDIEDKTALFTQARELAYNKAKQKASELAKLSEVSLLDPVSISDTSYDITPPSPMLNYAYDKATTASEGASQISTGQLELSINLSVVFGIE